MGTKEQIIVVESGVKEYEIAEQCLKQLYDALSSLAEIDRDGFEAGMISEPEFYNRHYAHKALAGQAAAIAERVYMLHSEGTKIAKSVDADVALPSHFADVGLIDVVALKSGGR